MTDKELEILENELRQQGLDRGGLIGRFASLEWQAADTIQELRKKLKSLNEALRFADEQIVKLENLLEPHIIWKDQVDKRQGQLEKYETALNRIANLYGTAGLEKDGEATLTDSRGTRQVPIKRGVFANEIAAEALEGKINEL